VPARPWHWLDVFTATPLTGNGLAVVHDADSVNDATMLAFARETRLSETTFVQTATAEGADYRNRIWYPMGEMDFAGHPSLGTAVAVAVNRGEREASYVQQTPSGLQPIEVRAYDDAGRIYAATMLQNEATFGAEYDAHGAMRAAGLDDVDAHPEFPVQTVSTGQPHLMVPVRNHAALEGLRPDPEAMESLMGADGSTVLYVFAVDQDGGTADARGVFIDRGAAVEDPATGSAAGPLMAYLHARLGMESVDVAQGVAMGRPGLLRCSMADGRPRVGGDVVVLASGSVEL